MSDPKIFKTLKLEIEFPFVPYGIQKVMMCTVVRTLLNKQHSLIESPTGTGKTLSLLCAALAWQKKSKSINQAFLSERLNQQLALQRRERILKKPCTCGQRSNSELDTKEKKCLKDKKCDNNDLKKEVINLTEDWPESDEDEAVCKKFKRESKTYSLKDSGYFKKNELAEQDLIIIDDDDEEVKQEAEVNTNDDDDKEVKQEAEVNAKKDAKIGSNNKFCLSCAALKAEENFSGTFVDTDSMDGDAELRFKRIPRIYYGTRTHKQITQVVRELNKTPYSKDLKMCILSARERTCINNDVKDLPNRNDKCQELIKNKKNAMKKADHLETCPFYYETAAIGPLFSQINEEYKDSAWDIEDAAKFGREHSVCPYYGVRSLQGGADITFSPYNYLLDPTIRETLDIDLKNAIVIIDEAHNIEDICRESASFTIDTKQIEEILETINIASSHYIQGSTIMDAYQYFRNLFLNLKAFLRGFRFSGSEFTEKALPEDMKKYLEKLELGGECLVEFKQHLNVLRGDDDEEEKSKPNKTDDSQQPALSFNELQYVNQLKIVLDFMYSDRCAHLNDYRCVITKALESDFYKTNSRAGQNRRQNQNDTADDRYVWQFNLFCMNSGVAFRKIVEQAWSIIVASGTLSPIESLKSELGCTFTHVFEGNHVIPGDRIFASIVSRGPTDLVDLNCAFHNSMKLDFQDEVGRVVRDICLTVPSGVLCFFPSYDRMETLYKRWSTKNIIKEIQKSKKIFREEKNATSTKFEQDLQNYNKFAQTTGALLFAVFRGKVSEGIDFADNAARAVITIGIPFPNVKETFIEMKRDYNNTTRKTRPELMPGREWYASQGFRALNQALGRCIRHKEDWGAIIMIDSRLSVNLNYISKWLRSVLPQTNNYSVIHHSLKEFVARRSCETIP